MSRDQRREARAAVQAAQAAQSHAGQLALGRLPPSSRLDVSQPISSRELEAWSAGNMTRLQHILRDVGADADLASLLPAALACLSSRLGTAAFAGTPTVSVLLEYFRRPWAVVQHAANMRRACAAAGVACELVVNVDNPHEAGAWAAEVADGFVVPVFSSNVHESRGYNRAAKAARGEYLVIWQDDQLPPPQGDWLTSLSRLLVAYPRLGIVGLNCYRLCRHKERGNRRGPVDYWAADPRVGAAWTFAPLVDFAPMAVRRTAWEELGGLEEGWSRPGDCGIVGDWELCIRAWMGGWQVAYMDMPGRGEDGRPGGTHVGAAGERCWGRQWHVAGAAENARHMQPGVMRELCRLGWQLNMLVHRPAGHGRCPYGDAVTQWGSCKALEPEAAAEVAARWGMAPPLPP